MHTLRYKHNVQKGEDLTFLSISTGTQSTKKKKSLPFLSTSLCPKYRMHTVRYKPYTERDIGYAKLRVAKLSVSHQYLRHRPSLTL